MATSQFDHNEWSGEHVTSRTHIPSRDQCLIHIEGEWRKKAKNKIKFLQMYFSKCELE